MSKDITTRYVHNQLLQIAKDFEKDVPLTQNFSASEVLDLLKDLAQSFNIDMEDNA